MKTSTLIINAIAAIFFIAYLIFTGISLYYKWYSEGTEAHQKGEKYSDISTAISRLFIIAAIIFFIIMVYSKNIL